MTTEPTTILGVPTGRADRRGIAVATARSTAAALAMLVAYFLVPFESSQGLLWRSILSVVILLVVVAAQIRGVVLSNSPMVRAVEGLVVAVTLVLVVSAAIYLRVSDHDPAAFSEELDHIGGLYLATMTMTTVGFGDIAAVSDSARVAVMVHMLLNIAILGVAAKVIFSVARSRSLTVDPEA